MEIALSLWPIARKKLDLVSVYQGALVGGFVNIKWSTLTNKQIIFKPLNRLRFSRLTVIFLFIRNFVFTSESFSLFRVWSLSSIFLWTTIANISAYIVIYYCSRENETFKFSTLSNTAAVVIFPNLC